MPSTIHARNSIKISERLRIEIGIDDGLSLRIGQIAIILGVTSHVVYTSNVAEVEGFFKVRITAR